MSAAAAAVVVASVAGQGSKSPEVGSSDTAHPEDPDVPDATPDTARLRDGSGHSTADSPALGVAQAAVPNFDNRAVVAARTPVLSVGSMTGAKNGE